CIAAMHRGRTWLCGSLFLGDFVPGGLREIGISAYEVGERLRCDRISIRRTATVQCQCSAGSKDSNGIPGVGVPAVWVAGYCSEVGSPAGGRHRQGVPVFEYIVYFAFAIDLQKHPATRPEAGPYVYQHGRLLSVDHRLDLGGRRLTPAAA